MYFACTKAPWKNDTFIANAVAGMPRTFVLSVFVFTLREWGPRSSKCAQHASPLAGRQEQRTTLAAHIYLSPRTTRPHTPSSTRITLSSPTQARRALGLLLMPWCNSGMESHSVALMAVPRARGKTDIKTKFQARKACQLNCFPSLSPHITGVFSPYWFPFIFWLFLHSINLFNMVHTGMGWSSF